MVSVIIPSYNRAGSIERSIRSVLEQTVSDLEVIVVDDCSIDNTEEVVKGIGDARIFYYRLEKNSGACVARNKGVEEAKGEFIAFQDSDDEWVRNKLEIQLKAIEDNDADICSCLIRRHAVNDETISCWPPSIGTESRFLSHETLRRLSYVSTQSIVAKRYVFDKYLFDPDLLKSQDYDWVIRASKEYNLYFVCEPLVEQYLQKDSISLKGYESFVKSRQYLLNKYKDICAADKEFELHLLKQLAHYKSLAKQDATEEYAKIYAMERNLHNFLCKYLSKMHLLNLLRNKG